MPHLVPVLRFFGWFGFLLGLYILSFPSRLAEIKPLATAGFTPGLVYAGVSLLLAALIMILFPIGWWRAQRSPLHEWSMLAIFAVMTGLGGFFLWKGGSDSWITAGIVNLAFLWIGLMEMWEGLQVRQGWMVIRGAALLLILTFARYNDLFDDLLSRGLAFIITGGLVFAAGIRFTRSGRQPGKEVAS